MLDKKTSGGSVKSEIMSNQEIAKEFRRRVIRKFKKPKVQSSFIDSIWGVDLGDMHLWVYESNPKPNQGLVDKGRKFYNRWMKLWLQDNDAEMYSVQNERKSVVAERFITLKNKIYNYMTSISNNV